MVRVCALTPTTSVGAWRCSSTVLPRAAEATPLTRGTPTREEVLVAPASAITRQFALNRSGGPRAG